MYTFTLVDLFRFYENALCGSREAHFRHCGLVFVLVGALLRVAQRGRDVTMEDRACGVC